MTAIAQKGYILQHYTDDNGLPMNSVKAIASDSEGYVWLATENGLTRFDGRHFYTFDQSNLQISSNNFDLIALPLAEKEDSEIKSAPYSRKGSMYAVNDRNQFIRIKNGIASVDSAYQHNGKPHGDIKLHQDLFSIANKRYRFNHDGTVSRVTPTASNVKVSGQILASVSSEADLKDIRVFWNAASDQVFFYLMKNLYVVENELNGQLHTRLLVEDFDVANSNIQSIYYDSASQIIFLGSASQGLFTLTKKTFQVITTGGSEVENVFYSQIEFEKNQILTPTGLLISRDSNTGHAAIERSTLLASLNPGDKQGLLKDRLGYIWIKADKKLYQLEGSLQHVVRQWDLGDEIKHIYEGKRGLIWIGTSLKGLFVLESREKEAVPKQIHKALKATYLASDNLDKMYIGTTDGLYTYCISKSRLEFVRVTKGIHIKRLHLEGTSLWMTTYRAGLMLYSGKKLVRFPLDKRKYLNTAHCIVNDGKGYFWVTTDKGLFQLAIRDLLQYAALPFPIFYMYYGQDQGVGNSEFNGGCQPCGVRLTNGNISFPSLKGLVWFDPGSVNINEPDGAIVLDQLSVNNLTIYNAGEKINLPLNPVSAKFHFSTPYHGNDYNLHMEYALVENGVPIDSADWIPFPGEEFEVTFSNLSAGNYSLAVRKLNGFGKGNYSVKRIALFVPPFWYQTWWARVLFILGVIMSIFGYNFLRMRQIGREKVKLEETVAKRTESLNQALKDVEQSKSDVSKQLHMLSRLLTSMTHDIQSPLNYINLTSSSIPVLVARGDHQLILEIGAAITDSSQRMSTLLRGLLDYIKIHVYNNRMPREAVNLKTLTENKFEIFKNVISLNHNRYSNEIEEDAIVFCDQQMLSIMIHNLIDNAAKFTTYGLIRTSAVTDENHIKLIIANTGSGIPPYILEFMNKADKPGVSDAMEYQGKKMGLGLLIVKEIAAILNVSLVVTQAEETVFTLTLEKFRFVKETAKNHI